MPGKKPATAAAEAKPAHQKPEAKPADVVDEADDGEAEDDEPQAKKHNTGAVDLEKVTDFFEEKELIMSVGQSLNEIIEDDTKRQKQEKHDQAQREAALAQVQVDPEEVALLASEFDLDVKAAERLLRQHDGDLTASFKSLLQAH